MKNTITGISDKQMENIKDCEICVQAKQTKNAVEKGKPDNTADAGELLHIDLMGPITPSGKNDERYIINILDEKSKFGFSKSLRHKSDATKVIKHVIRVLKRQT